MMLRLCLAVMLLCAPLCAAQTSQPAPPTSEQQGMMVALQALYREYAAAQGKDAKAELRSDCDYFKENPDPDVTPASVVTVLERAGGSDTKMESYVRWQLLSIVPAKQRFDDSFASRLVLIYKRTPALLPRPGITPSSRAEMIDWTKGRTESEIDGIDNKLAEQMGRVNGLNSPVMRFRTELLRKMPLRYDTISLGFDDLTARVAAGVDDWSIKEFLQTLDKTTREWLATKPPADQAKTLAAYVFKIEHGRGAEYLDKLVWSEDREALLWKVRQLSVDHDGILDKLQNDLTAYASR